MKKRMHGFTLLEMMMVVAIAAIVLLIGVPSFTDFIRNARMTSAANDFIAASHVARSEAIKRRDPVTVCTSANALAGTPECDPSADLTGWIVFVDDNADGAFDAGEALLQQHAPIPPTISARGTLDPLAITYLGSGFAVSEVAAQILMCDARGNRASAGEPSAARGITIAPTGRASVTRNVGEIAAIRNAIGSAVGGCT